MYFWIRIPAVCLKKLQYTKGRFYGTNFLELENKSFFIFTFSSEKVLGL